MRKGVSSLVEVGHVLGIASSRPGKDKREVVLETRWAIPVGLALDVDGRPLAAHGVIVGVEKRGGVYRYRVKLLGASELRKPCQDKDLEASFPQNGSEHPGSDSSDPTRAG